MFQPPIRSPEDAPTDPDRLLREGTVASVDLGAARMVVKLDDGAVTGPIKWFEFRARSWSPPEEGELVMLLCPGGDIGRAAALRGLTNPAFPPVGDDETEVDTFSDGARITYDPVAHHLDFSLPAGGTVSLAANVAIDGNLSATGTITSAKDVIAAGISGKGHHHGQVKAGTDTSGGPQ